MRLTHEMAFLPISPFFFFCSTEQKVEISLMLSVRYYFYFPLSKECRTAQEVKFARIGRQFYIKDPDVKSGKRFGWKSKDCGDLFRILLNRFLRILKRKPKVKHEG